MAVDANYQEIINLENGSEEGQIIAENYASLGRQDSEIQYSLECWMVGKRGLRSLRGA